MPADQSPTRRLPVRLTLLSLTLTAVLSTATACASSQTTAGGDSALAAGTSAATATICNADAPLRQRRPARRPHPVTTLRITVGGQTVTAELNDTPTAQDLARPAPADHHPRRLQQRREGRRTAPTPHHGRRSRRRRSRDQRHRLLPPSNGLVFYYGDVGYFNGIVRLGRLSAADMQLIRRQTGNFTITIEEG